MSLDTTPSFGLELPEFFIRDVSIAKEWGLNLLFLLATTKFAVELSRRIFRGLGTHSESFREMFTEDARPFARQAWWHARKPTLESFGLCQPMPLRSNALNSETDSKNACIVCFSNIRDTILLPCGHFILCGSCAVELMQPACDGVLVECPMCRKQIHDLCHVYT